MAKKKSKRKRHSLQASFAKTGPNSASQAKTNPFEILNNRKLKHHVLNRKVRGSSRNMAASKASALQNRYTRLSATLKKQIKSNTFKDGRFGEQSELSLEERALLRFQKTRSKKSRYNLDDNVLDTESRIKDQLTHMGQALGKSTSSKKPKTAAEEYFDDETFDPASFVEALVGGKVDPGSASSSSQQLVDLQNKLRSSNDPTLSSLLEEVNNLNRPKDGTDPEHAENRRTRSREEVMKEVMLKAKLFKASRQREKEQLEMERERADELFTSLLQKDGSTGASGLDFKPGKGVLLRDMSHSQRQFVEREEQEKQGERDDFDRLLKDLAATPKVEASEKTLTDKQLAEREKRKLEQLQKELNDRLREQYENDDFDNRRKRRKMSGEESPVPSDEEGEPAVDKYGNVTKNTVFEEGNSQEDVDVSAGSSEEGEDESKLEKPKQPVLAGDLQSIPYVIRVSESFTHVELCLLLQQYADCGAADVVLGKIVDRIMKTNSIHLLAENRTKMILFFDVLLTHLLYLAEDSIRGGGDDSTQNQLKVLFKCLFQLGAELNKHMGEVFIPKLQRLKRNLSSHLENCTREAGSRGDYGRDGIVEGMPHEFMEHTKRGGHKGKKGERVLQQEQAVASEKQEVLYGGEIPLVSTKRCWPTPSELAFYKLMLFLFSAGDHRHPIVGTALLLISQTIYCSPLRGPKDTLSALALNQLLLEVTKTSKQLSEVTERSIEHDTEPSRLKMKYFPESLSLLTAIVGQLVAQLKGRSTLEGSYRTALSDVLTINRSGLRLNEFAFLKALKTDTKVPATVNYRQEQLKALQLEDADQDPSEQQQHLYAMTVVHLVCDQIQQLISLSLPLADVVLQPLVKPVRQLSACLKKAALSDSTLNDLVADLKTSLLQHVATQQQQKKTLILVESKAKEMKRLNPAFSVDYAWRAGSDSLQDKNSEKLMMKKLQKEVRREKRHVMKEVRRDAALLATEKQKRQQQLQQEERQKRLENRRFLEEMNRTLNNAVKSGAKLAGGGTRSVDMKGRRRR